MTSGPSDAQIAGLGGLTRGLFDTPCAVGVRNPRDPAPPLWPEEAAGLDKAVPKRQRESAAGRAAARAAMATLGVAAAPVTFGADRAPIWPKGILGSISHSQTACLAVLARPGPLRALGVDVEEARALEPDLIPEVCSAAEREWLDLHPPDLAGRLATMIFSAKESAYKAQYVLTQALFGFDGLSVSASLETGRFVATFMHDTAGFHRGDALSGRFAINADYIVTGVEIPA